MTGTLNGPMLMPETGAPDRLGVLLHGYGSDGNDLIGLAPYLRDLLPQAVFVAPNAPDRCAINPQGYQWFPLDLDRDLSRLEGIGTTRPLISRFLADLWAQTGLGPSETLLGGFSQGAMIALDSGLRQPDPLWGLLSFSGGVVAPEALETELKSRPPVCLIHGDRDDVVPVSMSISGAEALEALGVKTQLHLSQGAGHTIAQDGLEAARTFIAGLSDR